ncbi:hypothetical protein [Frigoribacterium sp. CG_9.8]|uniref:hypothetical protein n=1 Tax=Frigoribacterium sp. CG_9.8 TaxID=2787733 RepID=UPI0018CB5567|nr:hypothetical protein [Frigoribacterium sp. CG_9.8]MBG6106974.1 hypothetical protein [Frigoribacterium sp. CG_9.8]
MGELSFEIQMLDEIIGLLGPVRSHDCLLSFAKVVVRGLACKHPLDEVGDSFFGSPLRAHPPPRSVAADRSKP